MWASSKNLSAVKTMQISYRHRYSSSKISYLVELDFRRKMFVAVSLVVWTLIDSKKNPHDWLRILSEKGRVGCCL